MKSLIIDDRKELGCFVTDTSAYSGHIFFDIANILCISFKDGSSYAFSALTIEGTSPAVESLGNDLGTYEHLQHINMSKNALRGFESIENLPYLLTVNFSKNCIANINFLGDLGETDRLSFLHVGYIVIQMKFK